MDFLNKAFTQLSDLFRSMSPGGRITAGLLLVVAVASVGYLFQSQMTGGDDYLFSGDSIPTPTLQKMEEAFGKAGLNGFTIEGGRVKVPHAQRAAYLAALADAKALPPNFGDKQREANDGNLFDPPKQREQRLDQARQDEMSQVLTSMKGIERASVMIDKQASSGLGQSPQKTASVFASAIGGVPLSDEQVDAIRYYVVFANAGMKTENVMILDANGPARPPDLEGGGGNDPYTRAVRRNEEALNAKIRASLAAYIPSVTVTSTVELDHEKGTRTVENKFDPKPVPVRSMENSRSTIREATAAGGAPGLQPQGGGVNQPASIASAGGKGPNETSEENKSEVVNANSSKITETETYGLVMKSAKVSVGIPVSHFEKVWREQNPVKEGEEVKKPDQAAIDKIREEITQNVRATVATLLPNTPDVKDPTALVTVTTFQDIRPTEIPAPAITQRMLSWVGQNWSMVAMVGLVLMSVGMLRSVLRGVPAAAPEPTAISARITAAESKTEEKEEMPEVTAARRLRRISGSGPSLRDELSELVKEDPDSAASILRTWIGQVN
jgi:flagellar M-ring protein FliF